MKTFLGIGFVIFDAACLIRWIYEGFSKKAKTLIKAHATRYVFLLIAVLLQIAILRYLT